MVSRKLAGWGTVAIVVGRFINQYLTVFVIKTLYGCTWSLLPLLSSRSFGNSRDGTSEQ